MASGADQPDPAHAHLPEHARRNRAAWNADADDYLAQHGTRQLTEGMGWGTWFLPESELRVLGEVAGRAILEPGCGSAQWSMRWPGPVPGRSASTCPSGSCGTPAGWSPRRA
ncbi:MAG TPA: hypothetical protein VGR74_04725 [Actinomycetota bacterium]|nr:hypothetical protein [Actinomycetota bacterium]